MAYQYTTYVACNIDSVPVGSGDVAKESGGSQLLSKLNPVPWLQKRFGAEATTRAGPAVPRSVEPSFRNVEPAGMKCCGRRSADSLSAQSSGRVQSTDVDCSGSSVPVFLPSLRVSMEDDCQPSATISPSSSMSSTRSSYDGMVLPAATYVQSPPAAVPVFASNRSRRSLGRRGTDVLVPENREALVKRLLRSDPTSQDYNGNCIDEDEVSPASLAQEAWPSQPRGINSTRLPPLEQQCCTAVSERGDGLLVGPANNFGRPVPARSSASFSRVAVAEPLFGSSFSGNCSKSRTESDPGTGLNVTLRDKIMARRLDKKLRVVQPASNALSGAGAGAVQKIDRGNLF